MLVYTQRKRKNNSLSGSEFDCKICEKVFRTLSDIMTHNKQEHNENVADCYKEASRNCKYRPKHCWFCHKITVRYKRQKDLVFKCRICEQVFNIKPTLMKHRKGDHNEIVESCFNAASETCTFGAESCWYNH